MKDFPVHSNTRKADPYAVYELNEGGKSMLNEWFKGSGPKHDFWTVKQVSEKSAKRLYGKYINPIHVHILETFLHRIDVLHVCVYSIDDGCYNIFMEGANSAQRHEWLNTVREYIDSQPVLDGDELVAFCQSLGECEVQYD